MAFSMANHFGGGGSLHGRLGRWRRDLPGGGPVAVAKGGPMGPMGFFIGFPMVIGIMV